MKRLNISVRVTFAGAAVAITGSAFAQSSVTLYGAVDNGIGYQTSQTSLGSTSGGRSAVKMINGVWLGSRFGLKGAEDLGGGSKAIFRLEEGLNSRKGALATNRLMFNLQAFVGVLKNHYGSRAA